MPYIIALSNYHIINMKNLPFLSLLFLLTACNPKAPTSETTYQLPPEIEEIAVGNQYGLRAAELFLPNENGEEITLSSLRGNLVLVDFWASWCPPCRKENPALIRLYETYKDKEFVNGKGFTIYSVSLDRSKEAWLKAIEEDQLSWPIQVCDLLGAKSEAAMVYGVQSIPSSFLLDQNGVVIGVNLRGEELEKTIGDLVVDSQ